MLGRTAKAISGAAIGPEARSEAATLRSVSSADGVCDLKQRPNRDGNAFAAEKSGSATTVGVVLRLEGVEHQILRDLSLEPVFAGLQGFDGSSERASAPPVSEIGYMAQTRTCTADERNERISRQIGNAYIC